MIDTVPFADYCNPSDSSTLKVITGTEPDQKYLKL